MADSISPNALHHIAIATSEPDSCARFYETVMGMTRMERPAFSFGGAWLYHTCGPLQIHLIEHASANGRRGPIDTLAPHFAMEVDELDTVEKRIKEHGIEYKRQINAAGFEQIFFQDPDGNTIEIGVYPSDRSAAIQ
jgi:catechol 2,3-dioxygenase-like lactoylglutathione lyase family enzyme